jgi:hydrogenase-4 component B
MIALLLCAAIGLSAVSGLPAALMSRSSRAGERLALALLAIASACGLVAAAWVALRGETIRYAAAWAIPGELAIRLDPLAAIFLVQIFAITPLGAMYGLSYWAQAEHPDNGRKLRLFYGLLAASMALLVVADDAIPFLMGWELMALAAFVVVTTDDADPAARDGGFVYLVATRVGTLGLFAAFALLRWSTGSFGFHPAHAPAGTVASAIFLLGLLGCLLKAGAMPTHIWLPGAHANAPSHVSAIMSGVLIKMGIYGVLRITSFFEHPPLFWGVLLFSIGALSGVLGVAFALGQHDIKRLLAYHSVENIGIILIGLGVALVGRATGEPVLVALGLAGALLHVWNHGLFKSLLFFSAGAVVHATHTREMDALGGVGARMPRTALAFLVGAVAICGLPPFNGFVSELMIYLGSLHAALSAAPAAALVGVFGVASLALIGALAVACFVKAFGVVFLGSARSEHSTRAKEAGAAMTTPMLVLGLLCLFIGVAPVLVAPILERAVASWSPETAATSLEALAPLR